MRFICLPPDGTASAERLETPPTGQPSTEYPETAPAGQPSAQRARDWSAERRAGHRIGVISLGRDHLFFRKGLRVYVLPYARISRYFRRVLAVPARIGCCAGGELRIEHLVLCAADAHGTETELAQIQLPGERAAKAIMKELARLAPDAAAGRPVTPPDSPQSVSAAPRNPTEAVKGGTA